MFFLLAAFASIAVKSSYAQKRYLDSLDFKLTQAFNKTNVPGFTAIIVDRKGIVYRKSLGYADIKTKASYTTHTIQNIGSVSKTFIAVCLMKAVELGYFNLETNINEVLPFKVQNPYYPTAQITIKQLATHTSGIIDNDSIYHRAYNFLDGDSSTRSGMAVLKEKGYSDDLPDMTFEEFMYSYLNVEGKLYNNKNFYNSKPGERSSYSNIASALAAYIIQLKAGISFAAFSEKYILQPLQMNHSAWFLDKVDMKKHATPYVTADMPLPFYSFITYPDGGLITSADDLTKYELEMIRSLNGESKILSKKSVEVMFSPAFSAGSLPQNFNASKRTKGIFWNLYTDGFIGHDGDDPGVSTNILFDKNCGIIFMTNIYMEDRSAFLNPLKEYARKIVQK